MHMRKSERTQFEQKERSRADGIEELIGDDGEWSIVNDPQPEMGYLIHESNGVPVSLVLGLEFPTK